MSNSSDHLLVSIVVITYNSSKYVIETLESAKAQTYQNLELIISDDCSTDDTVKICREWLENNAVHFSNTQLIVASTNLGIPGNCNQGLNNSNGDWVKFIAGDDILMSNCIEDNVIFSKITKRKVIFSEVNFLFENKDGSFEKRDKYGLKRKDPFYFLNERDQFLFLLINTYPMRPSTLFLKKEILDNLGGFDTRYANEDFPFYLNATFNGIGIDYFNKKTVLYRVHSSSISFNNTKEEAITKWKLLKMRKTIKKYISSSLWFSNPLIVLEFYNQYYFNELILLLGNKKKTESALKFLRLSSPLFLKKKVEVLINSYKN